MAWRHRLKLAMRSFWSDPYLWIHLSGLAAFLLFLEGCLVGFAIGDPLLPVSLELILVAIIGIAPILWMQWQRPFYIFSLVAVTVKPEKLTDDQRRLLSLFKQPRNRILALIVPVVLVVVLRQVYGIAPIAAATLPFSPTWRPLGLMVAALSFLACNLFVQVPVSVASVMLTSESAFATTSPFPPEQIQQSFTLIGLRLNQIVPPIAPLLQRSDSSTERLETTQSPPARTNATPTSEASADVLGEDLWQEATPSTTDEATSDRAHATAESPPSSPDSTSVSEPEQP